MNRGTASVVQLGKGVTAGSFSGLNVLTNVILGKKEALQKDFNGLVLTDLVMLGKKISHITIITVTVGPAVSPLLLPDAIADSLTYVKAYGGTEQRDIPDNYLQRQFIYMMDGSYIKIEDLPISAGYRVEFDFQTLTLSSPLRNYLGGRANGVSAGGGFRLSKLAAGGTTLNRVVLYGFESGTEYYDPTAQFQPNTRYKYTYNNGVCTLETGGSVVSTRTFTVTDDTSTKWGINSYVSGNDSWQTDSDGIYVYSVKVWNNQGKLVMNLVPAVQKGQTMVVGFYDRVTGGFRTPTAGTFAAGGEAVPTPDAPMDIVSNNGVIKLSPNLFDQSLFNTETPASGTAIKYTSYQIPNGTYTMSTDFPKEMQAQTSITNVFIFAGQTTSGASSSINGVHSEQSRTITVTDGYYTIAYRSTSQQNTNNPADYNWMLVKGSTATPYIPYGQIYTDGTVETVTVYSPTLIVESEVTDGIDINSQNGIPVGNSDRCIFTPFFVKAGTKVTWSAKASNLGGYLIQYSQPVVSGAYWISSIAASPVEYIEGEYKRSATATVDCYVVCQGTASWSKMKNYNWRVTKPGSTATAEMLLKIGDYQDVQEILSGAVTRNVGVKVLDGNETDWTLLNGAFRTVVADNKVRLNVLCNMFNCVDAAISTTNMPDLSIKTNQTYHYVYLKYLAVDNVDDWKQWLASQYAAGTPVIIVYPLDEPTTESVTGQTLQVAQGDNVLEITQASLNGLELEAQYEQGVQASVQEVEP